MGKAKKNEEQSELSDSEVFDSESEEDSSMMELSETSEDEDFIPVSNLFYPSKPTRRQRPKAVDGASERSERGRSALFKNPLFFLRDAIWRQHKIFLRGVPFL